jgi:probable rRNA maturation factor
MLSEQIKISFFSLNKAYFLKERRDLKLFIKKLFIKEKIRLGGLSIILCDDEYLLAINMRFLGHDDYTDTISFRLSNPLDPLEGEIYISLPRIKENAEMFGVSRQDELLRVIFHGALHLCGYKDKGKANSVLMSKKENHYLKSFKLRRKGSTKNGFHKKHI